MELVASKGRIEELEAQILATKKETAHQFEERDVDLRSLSAQITSIKAENEHLRQIQRRHDDEIQCKPVY